MPDQTNPPADGVPIEIENGALRVPDRPIVPFVEGDGIGADITPAMLRVVDAAVFRAYGGERKIAWLEVFAGEKAVARFGENQWLPRQTLDAMRAHVVSIKGPLATPAGGGIRSLNVAIRKELDLFACVRPVRYFPGVVSPLRHPENTRMVIFRENTEDIYAGIEWPAGSPEARRVVDFLQDDMGAKGIRFPDTSAVGVKPVSSEGSKRLIRGALRHAVENRRKSVTLVHKGNIMKHTEGAFMKWGYELAAAEFGARPLDGGPWMTFPNPNGGDILVKDFIADNFLQQILLKPADFDVVATLNLNGDYISDALAAQVGGIGISPGVNMSDLAAVFEATHGTAPKHAGCNRANPGSLILSAEMMLRHLGWNEAAEKIVLGMSRAIEAGRVTYDLARGRDDAKTLSTADFGEAVVAAMD